MDEKNRRAIYLTLNDDGEISVVEILFYDPIPIVNFSVEKIVSNKCGGCGARNQKMG